MQQGLTTKVQQYHSQVEQATPYLASRSITQESIEKFQLGWHDSKLVIPYLNPAGSWHLKFRCMEDHDCKELDHGKYSYMPGVEQHLFNAQTLLEAQFVVVLEGEIDAITSEQVGVPTVGYPGASTWQKMRHWRWCFDSCDEVVVVADGDEPGRKAASEVTASLRQSISADVRMESFPQGYDANSFITEFGDSEYLYLLDWI